MKVLRSTLAAGSGAPGTILPDLTIACGEGAVRLVAIQREGKDIELHAKERLAICVQHELDHLDGVLYIDYLSRLKRDRVLKKFQKQARRAG